ncbi:ATP-dependent RNA helicase SrmB [Thiosulfatimonas sediminis]|uniref:ATP-dependent RNA helicase SrmB n=1 Tax=Thiosulfatimonas sediminis TaxID=2675054 RepID=A0A6F8PS58_9GAMM|nr:DEAD/DEAH box helicase [Thiosulfatimonas sediminis]BBP44961.1 ATP-dependent RNA helicase SrmB [Thiosulfatimonas sediminis]
MTFDEFDLDSPLLEGIAKMGYHKPTPVQQEAIPAMLERADVLVGAATGTGKTAAFVLPALQYLLDEPRPTRHPRILILAPTRELAFQIHKTVKQLSHNCDFPTAVITGGFNQATQAQTLRKPTDIIVATPGRLAKMMEEDQVNLSYIELLVLDEADRMLDMGQGPTVRTLLEAIPDEFQAALFSATLAGAGVRKFAEDILDEPQEIQIDAPNTKSEQIQQVTYLANDKEHKNALLTNILQDASCQSAIVFCNKKERAIALSEYLQSQNISAQVLHGDFIQAVRMEKMHKFKSGKIKVLVATDIAARGLDMLNITHVINYDLPYRGDIYIHRIGRTGRAQQVGIAINLVERHDMKALERIEYHLQQTIPHGKIAGLEANFSIKSAIKAQAKAKKKKPKKNAKKKR